MCVSVCIFLFSVCACVFAVTVCVCVCDPYGNYESFSFTLLRNLPWVDDVHTHTFHPRKITEKQLCVSAVPGIEQHDSLTTDSVFITRQTETEGEVLRRR